MQTLLTSLDRLARDRALRLGIGVALAAAYACFVIAGRPGVLIDLLAIVLAPTIALWRRQPVLSLAIASGVLLVAAVRGAGDPFSVENVAPFTVIVLPILGASLDDRVRVRAGGLALAVGALVLTALWAGLRTIGASDALVLPTAVLLALPIAAAAVWRRAEWRSPALRFLRERLPERVDAGTGFRTAVGVAALLWLLCVVLDVGQGGIGIVLTALPIAAALPFSLSRPDLALGLTSLGLIGIAFTSLLTQQFGFGDALAMLMCTGPLFGAALRGTPMQRVLAVGVVAAAAVVSVAITGGGVGIAFVVLVLGVVPFGAAFAWRQTRRAGGLEARLTQSRARERAVERDVLLEQERNRLAREVHDVVAHSLAVVIAQADGARYAAQANPATVGPALEAIADTARDALGEVRTMLHDLRTSGEGTGARGAADLPALVEGLRALGVEVREAVWGAPGALDEQADQAAYRIVQEALTNALRHGRRGSPIDLELDWGDRALVVVVANALPDAPREATERAGHGIPGMRERAALAGGECTAGVGSTGVFRVRASLPLLAPAAGAEPAPQAEADARPADVLTLLAAAPASA